MGVKNSILCEMLDTILGEYNMKKEDFEIMCNDTHNCGWYIKDSSDYLWKDLQIHRGTGFTTGSKWNWGEAPGYYPSEKIAEEYLNLYLEKQKMETIEINVKVNGKEVPLDSISTETFEKVKKAASKPEYEGVLVGNRWNNSPRVFFAVTDEICGQNGRVVVLDERGVVVNYEDTFNKLLNSSYYNYKNIKQLGE